MVTLQKKISWILGIAAILLSIGCFRLPMGYYTFLRIVACIIAILAIISNKEEGFGWCNIVFAIVAVLFNPIFPIHLHSKVAWVIIDAVCAVWMGYAAFRFTKNNRK